ncbi:toxin secretion/lysis holin [Exiguobacterium phage vB_EalM-132]|nr:toxin secretion/lysis holin [Exiguobacterium phage vB_EalM-132]
MNMTTTMKHGGGDGSVKHYVGQIAVSYEWKLGLSVIGTIIAYIEGFYGSLVWVFLGLFLIDLVTGIMKSKHNGVPITSKRLRSSVNKLGAYMLLITALIITSKAEPAFMPIVTGAYYYFIFIEFKSIIENVEEMGVTIPEFIKSFVNNKLGGHLGGTQTTTPTTPPTEVVTTPVEQLNPVEGDIKKGEQ